MRSLRGGAGSILFEEELEVIHAQHGGAISDPVADDGLDLFHIALGNHQILGHGSKGVGGSKVGAVLGLPIVEHIIHQRGRIRS